jgi:CSLREA domain-containing protein
MTFLPLRNRDARVFVVVILAATVLALFSFEFISRSKAANARDSHPHTGADSIKLANTVAAPTANTYTWMPTLGSTDWQLPTNWSPSPRVPATSDILIFDGNVTPSPIVTNVPTQSIATLSLVNSNIAVTLNASTSGSQALTISGGGLNVGAGTSLTLAGSTALTISVASGSTGTVDGQIILQDAAHRVQASDTNAVKFQNGSIFTTSSGFTGNPFGSGVAGNGADQSVQFQDGSSAFFNAGSDPFGSSPNGVVSFTAASTETFNSSSAFSYDGRSYGNLILDGSQTYSGGTSAGLLTVLGKLTIVSGSTLTLSNTSGADLNLLGDLTLDGTLGTNGRTVKFQGSSLLGSATQAITTDATLGDVSISKVGGSVKLGGTLTVNGALQFDGVSSSVVDVIDLNSKTLNLNGTVGGTSTSTSNGFKGDSTGATLNIGGTGALGTLRFVSGSQTLKSLTLNRTPSGSVTLGSSLTIGSASSGSLTLTNGVVDVGSNTLSLASFPAITRTNGYVIGNLQKTFGGPGSFTFTVGTANGYSPLDANVTAGTGNSLTVKAVQGKHPNIPEPNALLRYWTMSNSGSVTANLTFHYSASSPNDIVGTEANYKIFELNASITQFTPDGVGVNSAQDHFATLNGVSSFSDWTLADPTLTVNTTDDVDNGSCLNSHCSLREAINAANFSSDPNTINFDPTIFAAPGPYTINLLSALPDLNSTMTINGPGASVLTVQRSTLGGTPDFRIFTIQSSGTANILGMTIANGNVTNPNNGGGVLNNGTLAMTNCNLYGNKSSSNFTIQGGLGGGIYNLGSLTVNNCNIGGLSPGQPNTATSGGGGVWQEAGTLSMSGGSVVGNALAGMALRGTSATLNGVVITNNTNSSGGGGGVAILGASTKIINCLIANNTTLTTGGGILNNSGTTTIINSTISGNSTSSGGGAGLDSASKPMTLINVTITNNRAGLFGGGMTTHGDNTVTMRNTIVAGNFQGASPSTTSDDIRGTGNVDATSSSNLIGACTNCGLSNGTNGNQVGVSNPGLGPLADNGGPTRTHALLPGSPAIDAGNNAFVVSPPFSGPPFTDQRGFARINNTTVDIGAFESRGFMIAATGGTPQSAAIATVFSSPLVATVSSAFGEPVAGGVITFTAPSSGPSGTFPGNVTTANATTDASGVATAPVFTANGNAGSYNVSASVGGGLASANFALTNTQAATTTVVSSSINPSEFGQGVTFTATVTSVAGTPTGTVQFKDGGVTIGSASTVNGVAQLITSSLTAGPHTITAVYGGDANFLTSSGTLSGGQVVKSQPSLSINDVSVAEGNSGTTNLIFTVTLSAASNLTVNVNYATADGTATTLADNDYQAASGMLSFNPGETTKTITVLVNGDQKFERDETFFVNLTNPVNATISRSQGVGTILNDDTLELILDESGPDANQAAAFDSLLFVRDPFHVQSIASWLDLGSDRNTRLIIFAGNLQLNQAEPASAVVVSLVDAHNQSFDVPAEDVRGAPNSSFTQVKFRLPESLADGVCMVTIKSHGQISNTGTIRIVLP